MTNPSDSLGHKSGVILCVVSLSSTSSAGPLIAAGLRSIFRGSWIPCLPALFAIPVLLAQPPLGTQDNHCKVQIRDVRVLASQMPAISIPGIAPADIMAVSVVGIPIAVSGGNSKMLIQHPTGCGMPDTTADLPSHTWRLDVPAGSHSSITESPGLMIQFKPDVVGTYTLHLLGCPPTKPCTFKLITDFGPNGTPITDMVTLPTREAALSFIARKGVQIPPLFRPADYPVAATLQPTDPQHYDPPRKMCSGEAGLVLGSPEWLTTTTWTGPTPPYELLEGRVYVGNIAGEDFPFNHNSNDVVAKVDVDPPFRRILIDDTVEDKGPLLPYGGIEVEWEDGVFPIGFRPVAGNRISVLGYHVVDCQHTLTTEIHPPIAMAVHRQSAIKLPATFALNLQTTTPYAIGSNVIVPGILTDVLVNLNGGGLLGNGSRGTHQPVQTLVAGPNGLSVPAFTVNVNQPTTAEVKFNFRVYLPPSPYYVLQRYGLTPSFKPNLYWKEYANPEIEPRDGFNLKLEESQTDGPNPYLRFSMDLSALKTGDRVGRRIEAAWVYPDLSGANWGLQNISIKLEQLKVLDTGDFTSGDWRLWATLSGSRTPWMKLIDCNGCIEQKTYTPQSTGIWLPGALAADGTLPGAVARFGLEPADQLQFTGYDSDALASDGIPQVSIPIAGSQSTTQYTGECPSCPSYSVLYSASAVPNSGSVSQATINYLQGLLAHPAITQLVHPEAEGELYAFGTPSIARNKIVSKPEEDGEAAALAPGRLSTTLQATDVEVFAQQLRKRILAQYGKTSTEASRRKLVFRLHQIKASLAPAIYQKYLCDLETGKPCVQQ